MNKKATRVCALGLIVCGSAMAEGAWADPIRWELAAGGNGHLYEAVAAGGLISWDDARTAARARGPGWDLATITSARENEFVKSLFQTKPTLIRDFTRCGDPNICWYRIGPWIGGFKVTNQRSFEWVTGEPVTFTNWSIYTAGPGEQIAYVVKYFDSYYYGAPFVWGTPNVFLFPIAYVAELTTTGPSLALKRSTVAGCKTVTATVVISQPAPPDGLVVYLSDTLASARPPATLKIPSGARSGNFAIRTTPVAASETGTVSATFGSTRLSQPLTVRPMGVQSLALSATTVVGGNGLVGKATLECKAAPGPITVNLGSNHPEVAFPVATSIVVPQGIQSETFDIATRTVPEERSVSITARANGIRKSKPLNVTPPGLERPANAQD